MAFVSVSSRNNYPKADAKAPRGRPGKTDAPSPHEREAAQKARVRALLAKKP